MESTKKEEAGGESSFGTSSFLRGYENIFINLF